MNENKQGIHLSLREIRERCEDFLHSLNGRKPETRSTYQRALRQFLGWYAHEQSFRFRVKDVERYKRYLTHKKHLSHVSVSTYLTAVRRFFQYFVGVGLLTENPAKFVSGNKRPMTHSRKALKSADVEKLLSSVDQSDARGVRDYAMLKTMLGCGLSEIEMIRADVGDVRQSNGRAVIHVQGKGHDAKDQAVVVPSDVKAALDSYLAAREEVDENQPLFLSAGNKVRGKRMTTRGIRERVNYYLKRAGIKRNRIRRVTPYSLRHTAALMMVDAGASPEEIQERMRLGSIATAMIYVNQRSEVRRQKSEVGGQKAEVGSRMSEVSGRSDV